MQTCGSSSPPIARTRLCSAVAEPELLLLLLLLLLLADALLPAPAARLTRMASAAASTADDAFGSMPGTAATCVPPIATDAPGGCNS